jgi:hypothetical protein
MDSEERRYREVVLVLRPLANEDGITPARSLRALLKAARRQYCWKCVKMEAVPLKETEKQCPF